MHLSKHFDVKELILKFRHLLLLAGSVATASQAYALSIGSPRGNVYLGSAIDLSFQVQSDPGQTVDSSCVRAEVWMGDTTLLSKDVAVTLQPSSVRVRTSAPVYEPLVTIKLTAGCSGAITRSYTLFADPPATMAAAVAPIDLQQLQVNVPASTELPPLPVARAARATEGAATAAPVKRTRPSKRPINRSAILAAAQPEQTPDTSIAPATPATALQEPAAPNVEQPRLRIEPIEGLDQTAPTTGSAETITLPEPLGEVAPADAVIPSDTDLQQLTDASNARLAAMEEQLKTLQTQLTTNRTEISGLHHQLAQAQNAPLPTWIYVLLGMLALALATIAWLLQRVKQERLNAKNTWADTVLAVDESTPTEVAPFVAPTVATDPVTHTAPAATTPLPHPDVQMPANATPSIPAVVVTPVPLKQAALPTTTMATTTVASVAATQSPPNAALDEVLTAQAMFDVQEQAEFYASIGENDHAIGILQNHIAQHEASSPLAYLELLQLLHRLSRTDAFAHASKKFQAYFNVNVPGFFEFADKGQNLASGYPHVLRDIEAQWKSDELPSLVRGLLVRDPLAPEPVHAERFDLAAFDDLLNLYNDIKTKPAAQRGVFSNPANVALAATAVPSVVTNAAMPEVELAANVPDSTILKLEDTNLDMLSAAPADFSQSASLTSNDSPYQSTSHFKADEALFDGLTLDWDNAAPTPVPPAATSKVESDPQLPSLDIDMQLQNFLQEEIKPTPSQGAGPQS